MKMVKKVALLAVLAFFLYAIVMSPSQAANIVQTAWDIIVQAVKGIGSFFSAILSKK